MGASTVLIILECLSLPFFLIKCSQRWENAASIIIYPSRLCCNINLIQKCLQLWENAASIIIYPRPFHTSFFASQYVENISQKCVQIWENAGSTIIYPGYLIFNQSKKSSRGSLNYNQPKTLPHPICAGLAGLVQACPVLPDTQNTIDHFQPIPWKDNSHSRWCNKLIKKICPQLL